MRIAWAALVIVGCRKAEPEQKRPVTPPPSVAPMTPDAPPDAEVVDASLAKMHRLLTVNDFSEMPYFGAGAIEAPGLPAIAGSQIAVAYMDQDGLGTMPNVEVRLLGGAGQKTETIPIWSQADSRRFLGDDTSPTKLRALADAIDLKVLAAEKRLEKFMPLPASCEGSTPDDDPGGNYCDGQEVWTCGDVVLKHPRTSKTGRREELHVGAKTISAKGWHKPPVQIYSGKEKVNKEETLACIHDARLLGDRVLLELRHACNVSGDWCSAGGPTWVFVQVK